ncbi:MAG TPA: hypothetical protein ENK37_07085 [Oceanithermus profundus]|uniref:DUF3352 domain-containing protein n=1 Tax=Oceanithermus profundus TaxID=187137 RepID=A0A7C4ZH73_9DEIN|nr:hypothetical protein [Oceanithermus profundus]
MLYKRPYILILAAVLLLATATAQSLPALAPPGATAGFYTRNLAIKKAFFIDFQLEWNRLGFFDLFKQAADQGGELSADDLQIASEVLNLDLVGREGLIAVYPSGDFFAIARPSADRVDTLIALLNKFMEKPEKRAGWLLERDDSEGLPVYLGHNGELLLAASEGALERFFNGERGLEVPIEGDLAYWAHAQPLWPMLEAQEQLPPELVRALKTFVSFAGALDIEDGGLFTRSRFALDPNQDPALAALFLPSTAAWPLGEQPRGVSAGSYVFDLAAFGDYVTQLAAGFGMEDLNLDLSAFGQHVAFVDAGSEDPQEALSNPLGNLLLVLETKDTLTAEVTLLTWLQSLAGFATPEGEGGFTVEATEVAGMPAKRLAVGMLGNLVLVTGEDRLYLATSERAAALLEASEKLADDPKFVKLAKLYLPEGYTGASYSNNRETLKQAAQMLPLMMMQTVDDPEVQAFTFEFADKLAQFLSFVAERVGSSVSYQETQGSTVEGSGFMEVAW